MSDPAPVPQTPEAAWYADRNCRHAHCPLGCRKPQPRVFSGAMVCGRCLVLDGVVSEMVPCTPETCPEAA